MKFFKLFTVLMVFALFSCQKAGDRELITDNETGEIYLIKEISNDYSIQKLFYDDKNRLIKNMVFTGEGSLSDIYDYVYLDEKSRAVTISVFFGGEKYELSGLVETFNDRKQPNNRFGASIHVRSSGVVEVNEEEDSFTYDENGFIAKFECFTEGKLGISATYEVDEQGNIIHKEEKLANEKIIKISYEYDDKKHYAHYGNFGISIEPMNHNIANYMVNKGEGSYSATYEYNEVGLPVKEIRTYLSGEKKTTTYEYERR